MIPNAFSKDPAFAWRSAREGFVVAPNGVAPNGNGRAAMEAATSGIAASSLPGLGGEPESRVAGGGWGERVLLVEADAAAQNLLAQMLSSLGYDVRIASDGASALQLWSAGSIETRPHLILADATMPDGGIELLRAVRAADAHFPVVLMTAFPAQAPLIDALRLRADDFLSKPFAVAELKTVLDRALDTGRKRSVCEQEEARAARLQAVLETAIAVNHEINNPLATISASAQLLRHHLQLNGGTPKEADNAEAVNAASEALKSRLATIDKAVTDKAVTDKARSDETADSAVMQHLLDVIIDQCERIACFNRKLNKIVNPVTRLAGGQKMLDVDNSRGQ